MLTTVGKCWHGGREGDEHENGSLSFRITMNNRLQIGYFFSDRHAGYYQVLATAHIRLYQHTDAKSGIALCHHARSGTNSCLKPKSSVSRPAAHVAFVHRSSLGVVESAKNILLFYMKAVDIVESAIPGFPHYRKTENSGAGKLPRAPLDDRVPYYTHTVGIGKQHRS